MPTLGYIYTHGRDDRKYKLVTFLQKVELRKYKLVGFLQKVELHCSIRANSQLSTN